MRATGYARHPWWTRAGVDHDGVVVMPEEGHDPGPGKVLFQQIDVAIPQGLPTLVRVWLGSAKPVVGVVPTR